MANVFENPSRVIVRSAMPGRVAIDSSFLVLQPAVDLVGQDDEVVADRDLGDGPDVVPGQDRAGRVMRAVDDDHLRPRRDETGDLVHVHPEVALLAERGRHATPPTYSVIDS